MMSPMLSTPKVSPFRMDNQVSIKGKYVTIERTVHNR